MEHKNIQSIFSLEDNEAAEVKRIKLLIAEDIDFNMKISVEGWVNASWSVPSTICLDVLDVQVNANLASKLGWGLLMCEAFKGYAKAVKVLLNPKLNVKVNLTDDMNWTALMVAACKGHAKIAEMLVNAKSHVNAKAENGETALIFATIFGHAKVAKVLLEDRENMDKADINETRKDGQTALMFAARFEHVEVAKILLGANADVNMKDEDGKTALDFAKSEIAALIKQHISKS